jgi:hypothetical protein
LKRLGLAAEYAGGGDKGKLNTNKKSAAFIPSSRVGDLAGQANWAHPSSVEHVAPQARYGGKPDNKTSYP